MARKYTVEDFKLEDIIAAYKGEDGPLTKVSDERVPDVHWHLQRANFIFRDSKGYLYKVYHSGADSQCGHPFTSYADSIECTRVKEVTTEVKTWEVLTEPC